MGEAWGSLTVVVAEPLRPPETAVLALVLAELVDDEAALVELLVSAAAV
jgi:hypothetical protein